MEIWTSKNTVGKQAGLHHDTYAILHTSFSPQSRNDKGWNWNATLKKGTYPDQRSLRFGRFKVVLRPPQRRHRRDRISHSFREFLHRFFFDSHERIAPLLKRDGRRRRRFFRLAQRRRPRSSVRHRRRLGLNVCRERQVGNRVLVADVNGCFVRQRPQNVDQRPMHLLAGSLEEFPATGNEERIAGKDGARRSRSSVSGRVFGHVIAEVAGSVARRREASDAQIPEFDDVFVSLFVRQSADSVVTADDSKRSRVALQGLPGGNELLVASGVIPVMMRRQHHRQVDVFFRDRFQDGARLHRIYDGGFPRMLVDEEIHVVVGQRRNQSDPHRRMRVSRRLRVEARSGSEKGRLSLPTKVQLDHFVRDLKAQKRHSESRVSWANAGSGISCQEIERDEGAAVAYWLERRIQDRNRDFEREFDSCWWILFRKF